MAICAKVRHSAELIVATLGTWHVSGPPEGYVNGRLHLLRSIYCSREVSEGMDVQCP